MNSSAPSLQLSNSLTLYQLISSPANALGNSAWMGECFCINNERKWILMCGRIRIISDFKVISVNTHHSLVIELHSIHPFIALTLSQRPSYNQMEQIEKTSVIFPYHTTHHNHFSIIIIISIALSKLSNRAGRVRQGDTYRWNSNESQTNFLSNMISYWILRRKLFYFTFSQMIFPGILILNGKCGVYVRCCELSHSHSQFPQ